MNRVASSTDHDIPALILKECKNNISYPVFPIWKESFESEVIPEDMKIQSITPIFKKGDKSDHGNYRPISLTSHLKKIFERAIRKKLVCHLEVIPEDMKIQSITPIFKKGDKSDHGNYRPISLTSHLKKIFERAIRKKLVCHLESNSILSNKQHGFRKGRSCLTHLLKHIDDIIQSLLNGNDHDVI